MKKLVAAQLLLFCGLVAAQTPTAPSSVIDGAAPEKVLAPSYTDTHCSGFVTREKYSLKNMVTGNINSEVSRMVKGEYIFLAGSGYTVGTRYNVVRLLHDANRYEMFPGQTAMLDRMGNLYADVAQIKVVRMENDSAVAMIEFSCESVAVGDTVVPFAERPSVTYRTGKHEFARFADYKGETSGRVVMGKDFDGFLGTGQVVYVNIGADQGLKPGDYLRITRSYDPKKTPPIERLSSAAPFSEDSQREPQKVNKKLAAKTPWRGVGEIMVLNTTPTAATAIITTSVEDMHPGDVVEVQK